jgi:hypothetical protein
MDPPMPGGRQVSPNRRLLPESKAGCECSQDLSPQSDEQYSVTDDDHTGTARLCSIPSSGEGDEGRWGASASGEDTIQPIFE